jgi:radical SAM superfamily enzyme YgiQ (UPF0313 family)
LLSKLREAGFDMFFIGVESFNQSSLLETAKIQNTALELTAALREIQSYGFIVVAGLIMGFDTDPADVVDVTLRGMLEAGLISGDPSLLTALPGTPLFKRMAMSGRLRDAKLGLGGHKYQTNIRYLKGVAQIREDFRLFVRSFSKGSYQYKRLLSFYGNLQSPNYLPPQTTGFADLGRMLRMTLRNARYLNLLFLRLYRLLRSPERTVHILRAAWITARMHTRKRPLWFYFKFWLFNWSNSITKYAGLSDQDFDIESVEPGFQLQEILPDGYEESGDEPIPQSKIRAQRKITADALRSRFKLSGR